MTTMTLSGVSVHVHQQISWNIPLMVSDLVQSFQSPVMRQKDWWAQDRMEKAAKKAWEQAKASSFSGPIKGRVKLYTCALCSTCIGPNFHEDQAYLLPVAEDQHMFVSSDMYVKCKNTVVICCGDCAQRRGLPDRLMVFDRNLWDSPIILKDESQTIDAAAARGWGVNVPMDWFDEGIYTPKQHRRAIAEYMFFFQMIVFPVLRRRMSRRTFAKLLPLTLKMLNNHSFGVDYEPRYTYEKIHRPQDMPLLPEMEEYPTDFNQHPLQPRRRLSSRQLGSGSRLRSTTMASPISIQA